MGNWDSYRDDLDALKIELEKLFEVRNMRRVRIAEEEEQQMMKPTTDEEVQLWLSKVQAVETEVDDLIRQIEELHPGGFCFRNLLNMPSSNEFEDIVADKLQAVMNLIRQGDFVVADDEARVVTIPKDEGVAENLPEDVLYEEGTIVGMESIFTKVWRCLEEEGGEGGGYVGIIGLYGMGGVGKTTLLKQIYRNMLDNYGQNNFAVVIWVSVSKELRLEKIQEKIGMKIGLFDKVWKNKKFEEKASDILKILEEKKFVLFMDELWERVDLTKVGVPFPNPENSSKIVFTTCSLEICRLMEADRQFKMNCLSEEEAWKLFETLVGDGTLHSHPEQVVDIARDISKECSGLPLALVSIGRALAGNKTPQEWRDVLGALTRRSQSKSSISGSDGQLKKDIYYNLKLSYDHLQNDMIKSCLLYCCLFPRNDKISKGHLIDCWIGEGFLDDRLRAQSQGYRIIDVLLSSCLLEEEEDDNYVKMHNWIHDMSLWIVTDTEVEKNFFVCTDAGLTEPPEIEKWVNMTRISMTKNGFTNLENAPMCSHLQTLFLNKNKIKMIGGDFFQFMRCLKVLNLSDNELLEFPSEISNLVSLQHLDLSRTAIKSLPNQLGALKKLKCLNLEDTSQLSAIPPQLISTLSVLHVLRLQGCGFLDQSGEDSVVCKDAQLLIEELFCLKNLSMLSIGLTNSHALQKLLSSYRLQSCIQSLWLHSLQHPKSIVISISYMNHLKTLRISKCEYLEELQVDFVREAQAQAISSFYFLDEVIIESCPNLQDLTWLILAPNLKHLEISQCSELEEIIKVWKLSECPELMRNLTPFLKLHFLKLSNLPNLRSIYWCDLLFPDLKDRIITECPKLQKSLPDYSKETITVNVPSGPSVPFPFSKETKDGEDEELVKIVECRENLISSTPQIKYDVFLSFRGYDTRNTFTSHLCKALRDKQIETFMDDKLNRGDEISPSLLSTIEESHISVVIFSKNYGSSRWCLEELVKIVECRENHKQIVIPVFYEIDPTDVRNQTGSYAEAFAHPEQRLDKDQRVQRWKDALKQAANLSGFDSRVIKPESELVNIIVDDVLKKLDNLSPSYNSNLPGMNSRIKEIESLLRRGDVRSLGIWGIGGIGKTTLAKEVFKKISCQFESSGFAGSVREYSKQGSLGLETLRQSLHSALLKDGNAYMGTFTEKRLGRKKLLIILDDVTDFIQIEKLIGDLDFLLESRIIVTSRDKQVLQNCGVNHIYQVEELCPNDALKLFCQHAFRQNRLEVDYKELSNTVVKKVRGVPLALKVLGSALFDRRKEVWVSALEKLENNFDKDIQKVLKISYDELDDNEKSIFLDIACFFKGRDIDTVKVIMDACGFFSEVGISNLIDKSLITKSGDKLTMHDLLQAMGKEIVRQESTNDPSKRTRLWHHKDIYDVLTKDKGTEMIEAISLNMSSSNARDINLTPRAFTKIEKLRLLNFNNCGNKMHIPEDLVKSDFTELKYFHWCEYPLKSLQPKFHFEKLVILKMTHSNIEELWSDGVQPLHNLKSIDLGWSQHLISLPDLSTAPNLENLILDGCTSLSEIPSSIQHLNKLESLILDGCTSLSEIPSSIQHLNKLKSLMLSGCTSLSEIPSSIQHLNKLESLNLADCKRLESIPDCTCLESLEYLSLGECSKLKRLPQLPTNLERILIFDCTSLVEIQSSFTRLHKISTLTLQGHKSLTSIPDLRGLKSLTYLHIKSCPKLKMLPELPNNIEHLKLYDVPIEEFPPSSEDLDRLLSLHLINCSMLKSLPSSVRKWKSLHTFDLQNCSKIDKLPYDIGALESLRYLDISYCEMLRELPQLPALTTIKAVNCTSLERLSYFAFQNDILRGRKANLINCYNLDLDALNDVVKDTLLKIQGQAAFVKKDTPWISPFQYKQVGPSTIYPESKIPEWFHYQSRGSFIDVKLPPLCFNCDFLCFALCVVVAISNPDGQCYHPQGQGYSHADLSVTYDYNVKSKDGNRCVESYLFGSPAYRGKTYRPLSMPYCGPDHMKSNHVIIGFGCYFFREFCDNEFSFQFNVKANHGYVDKDRHCKVEMCGVHLMTGLHLETSNESEEEWEDESDLEESDEEWEDESDLEEFDG